MIPSSSVPDGVLDKAAWVDVKEVDQCGEGLTQWEIDFIDSLHGYLRAGRILTEKQREALDRIRENRL